MTEQRKSLTVDATMEQLDTVTEFTEECLSITSCPRKLMMQLVLCMEELFVNIASYAYEAEGGNCTICLETRSTEQEGTVVIAIQDSGRQFNPLERENPDITLAADERQIGGLGIYMVKETTDCLAYRYEDGKNMLRLEKSWRV